MKGVIKEVGRYIVGQVVGQGSFGKVYKGVDRFDKSQVALKFISKRGKNKKELQGLRSENQLLKKISHKNIIKLLDFLQTPNEVIIITQFAGQNLADVLERKKKFTQKEVKSYCKQIFDALCYLDDNRIAHRDLKPQNILIQNQTIKICDFGFARKLSASTTFMNSLKGTPLYIAPEILGIGPLNYTKRVDVWSFGIIIYELFVGRPPFWAENLARLKPKILHQKVKFVKDMPISLRTLIDKMLQKNPQNRADWADLKKDPFFADTEPLNDISSNILNNGVQKEQNGKKEQKDNLMLLKKVSDKELAPLPQPHKLQKIATDSDVQDIRRIQTDLLSSKIQAKKLRVDSNFLQKIISLYGSYFAGQLIVPKSALTYVTNIFVHLLSKVKPNEIDPGLDITKKKQLLFCAIKLTQQDTDPQTIPNQLMMIGYLVRNNFDNISVDFQTDQDILQICLREVQACRTPSCFGHALTILGTLTNQAIITINNSQQFFIKVQEQKVVSIIAEAFQPIPSKRIVLQCLQKFIHSNQFPVTLSKNQQILKKIFKGMKTQAAQALLKKNFLIYNPITIYKQISHVESYAKILYECINTSDQFRKQFLKSNFWIDFLQHKNLKIFCLAYDSICIQKDKVCLIPNELMKNIVSSESIKNSTLQSILYYARAEFYLSKKQTQTSSKQQSTLKILQDFCGYVSMDEQAKKKACREVEGFLCTGQRIFEEVIGQTFCNILNDPIFNKGLIDPRIIPKIVQNLFNFKNDEQIKLSLLTASKIFIAIQEIFRTDPSKLKQFKGMFQIMVNLVSYFLNNGTVYQIQTEHGPQLTKNLLISIFSIIKMMTNFDQKIQFNLYCLAEQKGLHNLLVSDSILDKITLHACLTMLCKLVNESKYTTAILDFVGITLIQKLRFFLKLDLDDKESELVVQILNILSCVIKKNEQYASKIKQLDIISHFTRYLQHPTNENIRNTTLTLIGNMAKHSTYFFDDFANQNVFPCLVDTLKRFGQGNKGKLLKGIIYAVGNVSFYTDRFVKDFTLLIPSLYSALNTDDSYLISNTMSTISNLLRHSNCYLKALVQHKVIKRVMEIIMDQKGQDNKLNIGLSMLRKVLAYPEIFDDIPKAEFVSIYTEKVKIVGEENDCIKKIKSLI